VRLASEVLPIVSVTTLGFVVLGTEGAPLSLKEEHVEVLVAGHLMDQRRLDVGFSVRERTILLVFALGKGLGAELCLVLFNVVETLDLIVSEFAELVIALLVGAKFDSVGEFSGAATLV
jgi:hypothetical protein